MTLRTSIAVFGSLFFAIGLSLVICAYWPVSPINRTFWGVLLLPLTYPSLVVFVYCMPQPKKAGWTYAVLTPLFVGAAALTYFQAG